MFVGYVRRAGTDTVLEKVLLSDGRYAVRDPRSRTSSAYDDRIHHAVTAPLQTSTPPRAVLDAPARTTHLPSFSQSITGQASSSQPPGRQPATFAPFVGPVPQPQLLRPVPLIDGGPAAPLVIHVGFVHDPSESTVAAFRESNIYCLNALLTLGPTYLFEEGRVFDEQLPRPGDASVDVIRNIFRDWQPGLPMTDAHRDFLYHYEDLPQVYAVLRGRPVFAYALETQAMRQRTDAIHATLEQDPARGIQAFRENHHYIYEEREAHAASNVYDFIRLNHDMQNELLAEPLAMLYGGAHSFQQSFLNAPNRTRCSLQYLNASAFSEEYLFQQRHQG